MTDITESLWTQRYRPKTVSDCVLPERMKGPFQDFVDKGDIPTLLLSGPPGVGKTTIALAMIKEIGADYIMINGSNEGRLIDTFRTTITNYATSLSFSGGRKYIIVDESDYLNCLEENETVLVGTIDNYNPVSLKDLPRNEEFSVVSFNMKTGEFENDIAIIIKEGESDLYLVELEDGRTVTVTGDHPFIVQDENNEYKELSINDGLSEQSLVITLK